jgi:hypothetical protein
MEIDFLLIKIDCLQVRTRFGMHAEDETGYLSGAQLRKFILQRSA